MSDEIKSRWSAWTDEAKPDRGHIHFRGSPFGRCSMVGWSASSPDQAPAPLADCDPGGGEKSAPSALRAVVSPFRSTEIAPKTFTPGALFSLLRFSLPSFLNIFFRKIKAAFSDQRITEREKALWDLLDDIDTAGDLFKPEITGYFKYVNRKTQERHKYLRSDGYELFNVSKTREDMGGQKPDGITLWVGMYEAAAGP